MVAVGSHTGSDGPDGPDGPDPIRELARRVVEVTAEEVALTAPGRVAVLAPGALVAPLWDALHAGGLPAADPGELASGGLTSPLVVLAAESANGLEFDSVVVVEPSVIAGETARGLRTLYVALTRPTQRLTVVYETPPPAALTATG